MALAAVVGIGAAQAEPGLDRLRVEAFVDGAVREAMRVDHIAGVSIAIVDRSGVVMTRGYGAAADSPPKPMDADTLLRVGSISKTPVWIAIMQLVEQGKISLDDPINQLLPEALRIPDEGFRRPILVRHLMTHSAGFEDSVLEGMFVQDPARLAPLDDYLASHRVHRVREPGELAAYSNYGAALAGALVAHVSGQVWQNYAEQRVLRSLGMASATYREPYPEALAKARGLVSPLPAAAAAKLTNGFVRSAGEFHAQPFEYVANEAPAGALSASANDMAAYMRALLDPALMEKSGVLRAETALAMRDGLFANTPELGSLRHGFLDFSFVRGRRAFGHTGDLIYEHSTMEIYPDEGVAIFISVNTPTGKPLLKALPSELLDTFFAAAPADPPRVADARAEAVKVEGTYRTLGLPSYRSERPLLRFLTAFDVRALANGDVLVNGLNRYRPIGDGVFIATDSGERIAFHQQDGRMRFFDAESILPADRIGYFEQNRWLQLIFAIAAFAAAGSVVAAVRRLILGDRRGRAAALVVDGLCVIWLAAGAMLAAALWPWFEDPNAAIFTYPGRLYPAACWALLAAALATPLAAALAFGPWRPADWSRSLWFRRAATLTIFAGLGLTLLDWGLLGFHDW
jgi:CubicO group peptidase (beta-lactamase class C family)